MEKIMIVTDSCSDIRNEDIKKYNIEVVPLNLSFDDIDYKEGVDISVDEFYNKLESSKCFPKTSQASPQSFVDLFNKAKENNQEVLVLVISSGLSGTMQGARMAAQIADYEDHVHIVDTLSCLTGLRLIVTTASRLRDEGKSIDEIISEIESIRGRVKIVSICDTLEYFYRGGRVSKAAKLIGSLINIKPMVTLVDGKIKLFDQAIGYNRALKKAQEVLNKNEIDTQYGFFYGYTKGEENIKKFIDKTFELTKMESYDVSRIGAVSGCHIGPGGVCYAFVAKENK